MDGRRHPLSPAEWKIAVRDALKEGYFKIRNGDRIVCNHVNCNDCRYEPRMCPEIGCGSSTTICIMTHKQAVYEFYPESLI